MDSKRGPTQQGATRPCQRVANPVEKDKHSSKLIVAKPAQRGVDAGGVDAAMSDPLAVYLDKSNALLQASVLTPLEAVCKSVCVIRGAVSAAPRKADAQAMGCLLYTSPSPRDS